MRCLPVIPYPGTSPRMCSSNSSCSSRPFSLGGISICSSGTSVGSFCGSLVVGIHSPSDGTLTGAGLLIRVRTLDFRGHFLIGGSDGRTSKDDATEIATPNIATANRMNRGRMVHLHDQMYPFSSVISLCRYGRPVQLRHPMNRRYIHSRCPTRVQEHVASRREGSPSIWMCVSVEARWHLPPDATRIRFGRVPCRDDQCADVVTSSLRQVLQRGVARAISSVGRTTLPRVHVGRFRSI